jgi:hypothetical protein
MVPLGGVQWTSWILGKCDLPWLASGGFWERGRGGVTLGGENRRGVDRVRKPDAYIALNPLACGKGDWEADHFILLLGLRSTGLWD